MEDDLTLEELYLLAAAQQRSEQRHNKFMAALNGVDLDEASKKDDAFDRVKMRAAADLAGKSEEEYVLGMIGFEVEDDDD